MPPDRCISPGLLPDRPVFLPRLYREGAAGAKYPLISITRSVAYGPITAIAPLRPALTIAAFVVRAPLIEFRTDDCGIGSPSAHTLNHPNGPRGMATRFIEYAAAPLGMPHDPSGTGMRRGTDAAKAGPPKRPAAVRVSKSLQGGIA
jgi:hypothetical protein